MPEQIQFIHEDVRMVLGGLPVYTSRQAPFREPIFSEFGIFMHPLDAIDLKHHGDFEAAAEAAQQWITSRIEASAAAALQRIDEMFPEGVAS